jgi:hypothetical protein
MACNGAERDSCRPARGLGGLERHVFIVTYGCYLPAADDTPDPVLSVEHKQIGEFAEAEVPDLVMPQEYKDSIAAWYDVLRRTGGAGVIRADILRAARDGEIRRSAW